MALISCAECGREFSDKAAACPQCAAPIDVARADSKGASVPRLAHGGRLERRSHNEILIHAPGEQAFEHVRDALALMVDSLRVSTTPLSISAEVQVEKPPAAAKIRVLFEIPDSTTTLMKIEEMSGPGGSSMAAHNAIELVAKTIMEHVGESFHGTPDVSRNLGAKLNNIDMDTDTERENDLLDCPACGGPLAKTATSCPKCGAANTWLHPEIQRFIDAEAALKLPSSVYHYGPLWIRFTSMSDWHDDVLAIDFSVTPPTVATGRPKYWKVVLGFFGLAPDLAESDAGAVERPAIAEQNSQLKVFAGIGVAVVAVLALGLLFHTPENTSITSSSGKSVPRSLFDTSIPQDQRVAMAKDFIWGPYHVDESSGVSNYWFNSDGTFTREFCFAYGEISERKFVDKGVGKWIVSEGRYSDTGLIFYGIKTIPGNVTEFVIDRDVGFVYRQAGGGLRMIPGRRTTCS